MNDAAFVDRRAGLNPLYRRRTLRSYFASGNKEKILSLTWM